MRDINKNFLKLLILADHLAKDHLINDYHNLHYLYIPKFNKHLIGKSNLFYFIFPQMVCELPSLFGEWEKCDGENVHYKPNRYSNFYYAMAEFFGLSIEEYIHLFSPDSQNVDKFGGKMLSKDSSPKEMSGNIMCFLDYVLEQIQITKSE